MAKYIIYLIILLCNSSLMSQNLPSDGQGKGDNQQELKVIYINKDITTHLVAMEEIKYVDISVTNIVGNIPTQNTLRVKPLEEGANGVVTIITERYMIQFLLVYSYDITKTFTRYNIAYADVISYVNPETNLTKSEMYDYAHKMVISKKSYYDVSTQQHLMKLTLNNIYTMGKYFFIDVSMFNKTNIRYDIDQIRFKIEDKKQIKATNFQSVEINPLLNLQNITGFKKNYRNVFVFEKFTFPEEKVFLIEISEKQISGRRITLRIDYADVLNADTFIY